MRSLPVGIEHCSESGLYVGYAPGFPGAYSQGETLGELRETMREILVEMQLAGGEPAFLTEFVGVESVEVA
jgi:hypothetical protein